MAKKKTSLQLLTRYRALQYTTFASEFVSIFTPFIIMGLVNYEEWFTTEEGWKIGLGGTLALALMGIATFMVAKKKEGKTTNGYISLVVGWFAVAFIFMLLANIMQQITTIMLFGGLGLLGAFGLDVVSQRYKFKADTYKSVIQKAREKSLEEQAIEEIKDKESIW